MKVWRLLYAWSITYEDVPAGQSRHADPLIGEYFPAKHTMHCVATSPEDVPAEQFRQVSESGTLFVHQISELTLFSTCFSTVHNCAPTYPYFPGVQLTQTKDVAGPDTCPKSHGTHCAAPFSPAIEVLPIGHRVQVEARANLFHRKDRSVRTAEHRNDAEPTRKRCLGTLDRQNLNSNWSTSPLGIRCRWVELELGSKYRPHIECRWTHCQHCASTEIE